MIIRQLGLRQGRNVSLIRQGLVRFSSTETTTTTTTITAEQTLPLSGNGESSSTIVQSVQASRTSTSVSPALKSRKAFLQAARQRQKLKSIGTTISQTYDPNTLLKNPPKPAEVTLELLLASQSHLGHTTSRWNPQNSRYIFGIREGVHIISLDVTAAYLRRAAKVVEEVARRGGLILFAGTRPGQKECVVRAAEMARGYHVFERWIPGSLTNGQQILGNCEIKVVNALDEELPDYKQYLTERPVLKPDLVICLNPIENEVLLHECGLNNIPTIGIIDTDADPTRVTYPIPANDDSLRCVQLIAGALGRAGEEGQRLRLLEAQQGRFTYTPVGERDVKRSSEGQE
ncbi:40S ribosomal protein S2, putative [Talaromyces stipitatus ATCC 10500]|uniref:40S ribosomal protein S2, putative n=1 Tax=Talaromyces stipitatus (strain ATCC 10500 / CBS 375.48 / QM 6759 / NRRL 1006) TaxID=441959 RepID=B8LUM1_TALSN|nr:mitochondrial 37S ribosomal protein MRP4 [Talaromyces stipitatus ATCC 10500]EED23878.1 40S ribosomal protein S2, putative [Talaromyces stipitatus ATCC 10500]